jgi:hypothetical protein
MLSRTFWLSLAALALGRGSAAAPAAELIPSDQFRALHALIKPRAGEAAWQEISWLTDLAEARRKAAAEGKPIFVWSASGEPLGCT